MEGSKRVVIPRRDAEAGYGREQESHDIPESRRSGVRDGARES